MWQIGSLIESKSEWNQIQIIQQSFEELSSKVVNFQFQDLTG